MLEQLSSRSTGLTQAEADARLEHYGPNEVARKHKRSFLARLADNVRNPLIILLVVLAAVSYATDDLRASMVIAVMVVLGIVLRYFQETRADNAAEELRAMAKTTATVLRDGRHVELPQKLLVPGDVVQLSAGDMVPGACECSPRRIWI